MTTFPDLHAGLAETRRKVLHASTILWQAEAGEGDLERARLRLLAAATRYRRASAALSEEWQRASLHMPPLGGPTDADAVIAEGLVEDIEDLIETWVVRGLLAPTPEGAEIDAWASLAQVLRSQPNPVLVG